MITEVVEDLCKSLSSKINDHRITRTAALDYVESLIDIVRSKLPDKNNIRHPGYLICCLAHIYQASGIISKKSYQKEFSSLLAETESIPNVSDRVIVRSILAMCARGKGGGPDANWLSSVRGELSQIPSLEDRVHRFSWVAKIIEHSDKVECKKLLSSAMSMSNQLENSYDADEEFIKIIDYAHTIDPALANELIGLLDKDKAREESRENLLSRFDYLQKTKKIASNPEAIDTNFDNPKQLAAISLKNLGSLNANRIRAVPLENFKHLSAFASQMSIQDANHVWSWILENHVRKSQKSKQFQSLASIFDSICLSAELIIALLGRKTDRKPVNPTDNPNDFIIQPGDRDKIFDYIEAWLSELKPEVIKISDPFFGPDEAHLIKLIADSTNSTSIQILTSNKHIKSCVKTNIVEDFSNAWKKISDIPPPYTEVFVIGYGHDGTHPIHDRWIIADNSGIRLGTSTNSIGIIRVSEISKLDENMALSATTQIDRFLYRQVRDWKGHRINLSSFTL